MGEEEEGEEGSRRELAMVCLRMSGLSVHISCTPREV